MTEEDPGGKRGPAPDDPQADEPTTSPPVLVWCEVCGKEQLTSAEEAFNEGWDFAGPGGTYPAGVVAPRTCGGCTIDKTVWWRLTVERFPVTGLTERERGIIARILNEPAQRDETS
jgi:hypothetical protein